MNRLLLSILVLALAYRIIWEINGWPWLGELLGQAVNDFLAIIFHTEEHPMNLNNQNAQKSTATAQFYRLVFGNKKDRSEQYAYIWRIITSSARFPHQTTDPNGTIPIHLSIRDIKRIIEDLRVRKNNLNG